MPAAKTIRAFGLDLTPEEWTKQAICRCGSDELRERIRRGQSPDEAITTPSRSTRRFRGISYHKPSDTWVAQIKIEGNVKFLGNFKSDVDAALAFDEEAYKLGRECNFR